MYIQFNNIKKSFNAKTVLDVENLQIEKGEIVSIIGKKRIWRNSNIQIKHTTVNIFIVCIYVWNIPVIYGLSINL